MNTQEDKHGNYDDILCAYFPAELQKRYPDAINQHPLAHEIIATILSNQILNHLGPVDTFELIQLSDNNIWKTVDIHHQVCTLFADQLALLPHQENVHITRLLMMILMRFAKQQSHIDIAKSLEMWLSHMPIHTLPEAFEFCCSAFKQSSNEKINVNELTSLYKHLNDTLGFNTFSELSKKLKLKTTWERHTKTLLLDDWTRLQIQLVYFVYNTAQGRAWFNDIEQKSGNSLEPVQVLARIQNKTIKHDLGFMSYFIRYFKHVIEKN